MKFSEREEKGNQKDVLPFGCQYSLGKKERSGQHESGLKIFSMYIHLQGQHKNPGCFGIFGNLNNEALVDSRKMMACG